MTEQPLVHCPKCNTDNLVRVIGSGAGLIFKGSGFYLTDYKKSAVPSASAPAGPSGGKKEGSTEEKGEKK